MAANKGGGDSKQGLIITLVIFVLLSIILSVVAYYGYADQQKMLDDRNKAKADADSAKKDRDKEQYQKVLLKALVGIPEKTDMEDLSGKSSQFASGPEFAGIMNNERIKGLGVGWDPGANKPTKTLVDEMARLNTELLNTRATKDKAEQSLARARQDFEQERNADQAALRKAREAQAAAEAAVVEEQQKKSEAYKQALEAIADKDKKLEELQKQVQNITDDKDKEINRLKKDGVNKDTAIKKLQDQVPQLNILDYDVAKGKIVRLDRTGNVAYINIGSADNVKPGLTFSVFGATPSGKPGKTRKGSIEVASVVGEHVSTARITAVEDSVREPILTGDLIFNPAWSPALREHIAIAGLIDLVGDGRDHTADFVRELEKQGIVVDAYLDLRDFTVKGKGMTYNTNYLVLGQMPEVTVSATGKQVDTRLEQKQQILTKVSEMQDQAAAYGVTKVPLRRFLSLIGYRVPRALTTGQLDFQYRPGLSTEGKEKEPAKKEDKPADKEDKGK
jgi:hypothetical protein